jgi:hypothetical protein
VADRWDLSVASLSDDRFQISSHRQATRNQSILNLVNSLTGLVTGRSMITTAQSPGSSRKQTNRRVREPPVECRPLTWVDQRARSRVHAAGGLPAWGDAGASSSL